MDRQKDTGVDALFKYLIEHGVDGIAGVFARAFELAMRIERERLLGAGHYERAATRQGYANGTKPNWTCHTWVQVTHLGDFRVLIVQLALVAIAPFADTERPAG